MYHVISVVMTFIGITCHETRTIDDEISMKRKQNDDETLTLSS
jgi:hypothetical protein